MANDVDGSLRTVFHQSDTWNLFNHLHSNLDGIRQRSSQSSLKIAPPLQCPPKILAIRIYIVNLKRQISTLEMAVDGFSWEISNNGRWSTLSNVVCTRLHRRVTNGGLNVLKNCHSFSPVVPGAVLKPLKRP